MFENKFVDIMCQLFRFQNNGKEVELDVKTSIEIEQMAEETEKHTTRHTQRSQMKVKYHHRSTSTPLMNGI